MTKSTVIKSLNQLQKDIKTKKKVGSVLECCQKWTESLMDVARIEEEDDYLTGLRKSHTGGQRWSTMATVL
jgi:hypothetical protein